MTGMRLARLLRRALSEEQLLEQAGEALLAELLSHPSEHHFELLDERRFQKSALVEPLLARSRGEQLRDWELSEHLACLAARLAGRTLTDADFQRMMVRAGALMANARRLAGLLDEAERALDGVALYAAGSWERVLYCRALGLVRWEQGQAEEGAGWLDEAARLFSELLLPEHEGEALTLLGLLQAEEGLLPQSTGACMAGLQRLPSMQRPWLAARGCLTLAANLAEIGCPEDASRLLQKGRQLTAAVDDGQEATFLYGLEGAVLGRVGEPAAATGLLRTVRTRHLVDARLPEAALASLELAALLAEQGRASEIEVLAAELEERFATRPATGEAVAALRSPIWSEPSRWRRNAEPLIAGLRHQLRQRGPRPRPLPFA